MKKKFHLAQYTMLPVTHHSMVTWKHPRNLKGGWRFDRPEVWQYMAQVCERGKFDFFFSADTEGIYSEYQQSYQPAVRYAAQGLNVPGVQGLVDMYKSSASGPLKTLGDIAKAHARSVSVPQIVGTGEQIAEWMASTIEAVGGDGFLLSPAYVPGSTEEFVELVIPELQRRGVVREEYLDGTLRDNLLAF